MDLAGVHKEYVKRMLDAAKGGMKALICDPETVRRARAWILIFYSNAFIIMNVSTTARDANDDD